MVSHIETVVESGSILSVNLNVRNACPAREVHRHAGEMFDPPPLNPHRLGLRRYEAAANRRPWSWLSLGSIMSRL